MPNPWGSAGLGHSSAERVAERYPAPEHAFDYGSVVADLPIPELVENRRRSLAMLQVGAPALNRDEALELLAQLKAALLEVRRLRAQVQAR
jgi:hypothetical protein